MIKTYRKFKNRRASGMRTRSRGIALIEALVGILIFTTGILGVVGLQAAMTKAQGSAKSRADASMLANELVGLMWSDYSTIAAGNIANYNTSAGTTCSTDPCKTWAAKVQSALPSGSAIVATNATSGAVTITISWTVPGEGNHQYVTSTTIQ